MLFPSTLVISPNIDSINHLLTDLGHQSITNNPDIFLVSEYTVENIRSINNFLSRAPYQHPNKIIIIPDADLLNTESQNTLLKNLEEPGENNYFILLTTRPNSLIATIISRCHLIRDGQKATSSIDKPLIFPSSVTQSLAQSDSLNRDKNSLLELIQTQISIYQKQLVGDPYPNTIAIINKLIKCTQMLNANVDPRATLDFLFLS